VHVTFYGAAREVTGSMHLLTTDQDRILLDCGLFQGRRQESDRKNRILPFDPGIITNVILSHAHIDHSGRIPLLTKHKFTGRIICTRATADACGYMLPDSAHIQESDAKYLNYKTARSLLSEFKKGSREKSQSEKNIKAIQKLLKKEKEELNADAINEVSRKYHLKSVLPLYTVDDAQHALSFFDGIPYRSSVTVGNNAQCVFYDAGHILGSAISIIRISGNGKSFNVCYTGDIGRFDKPILKNPTLDFEEADRDIDLLIMESTYGDREHEPVADMAPLLKQVICETVDRGGTILIPSFAFGRTQELLYYIHELYHRKEVPDIPVYVDSPLATEITKVFSEHPEMYDIQTHKDFLEKGENPFVFDKVRFIQSVEESMALMRERRPHIVISASGMCEAGRILHHLRYKIHDERNTILIVGFMAENTLGRRILEKGEEYEASGRTGAPPILKFLNKEYPLKARVVKLGGFSAHGDRNEMLRFVKQSNLRIKKIALVHGEESPIQSFADLLGGQGFSVVVPKSGESLHLPI
jgi:metallo-beta-lactamase family protein